MYMYLQWFCLLDIRDDYWTSFSAFKGFMAYITKFACVVMISLFFCCRLKTTSSFKWYLISEKWAAAWQNQQNYLCAQRRLRSAWASAQTDQSLCWALNKRLRTQCFFMRTSKTLIRLGRWPGWSESSLGAHHFVGFDMRWLKSEKFRHLKKLL